MFVPALGIIPNFGKKYATAVLEKNENRFDVFRDYTKKILKLVLSVTSIS